MGAPIYTRGTLNALGKRGMRISINDFGTGCSSRYCPKQLPATEVRIDASFVSDMIDDEGHAVVACATRAPAQDLGCTVVAEDIETHDLPDPVISRGRDAAQGYLISRPQVPTAIAPLLFGDAVPSKSFVQ